MAGEENGTGNGHAPVQHPLEPLSAAEISTSAELVRGYFKQELRFNVITLHEPSRAELVEFEENGGVQLKRLADVTVIAAEKKHAIEAVVNLSDGCVEEVVALPVGVQPPFSPDDCDLAEAIVKADERVRRLVADNYGIVDVELLACDPWSVHLTPEDVEKFAEMSLDVSQLRLVQTFLYKRDDVDDNHYAHPLRYLPVVDLFTQRVVLIDGESEPAGELPTKSVNYHRNKLDSNAYLETEWRKERLTPLEVKQPEGPSFDVDGHDVTWQKWTMRIGFNSREGLVLYDVKYAGRPVLARGSLVEMAVPYADTHHPFQRKCAFDVGDYGLGACANSLELGCDCLGYIHYFDGYLNDSEGKPTPRSKVICMHEEDAGLLWKHVEYRNGHSEVRRSRRLVLSFIATVVNYEYLFYWYFMQDGTIEFEIKLSGELSTNLMSPGEGAPQYGTFVAPGVNAQIHQHMFSVRLEMAVNGYKNTVKEVDVCSVPVGPDNPYGNAFQAKETVLTKESDAQRTYVPGRTWRIENPSSQNEISGRNVAYRLVPYTRGPAQPLVLTDPSSAVSTRGKFATRSLWVTPYASDEKFPAGKYPTQALGTAKGLPEWTEKDRSVEDENVVLWHTFGLAHVPRVEDFPVMPCEMTGFSLKPDGFFLGNPAVDLKPETDSASCCH